MASVLGEALGPSNGLRHAIKSRVRRGVDSLRIRADFPPVAFVQFRHMTGNPRLIADYSAQPTTALVRVFRATKAGALYSIIAFLIGFILGTIRVLLVAPRLGETTAVIVEAPIILAASWLVCRWCVDRLNVRRTVPARSLMGF